MRISPTKPATGNSKDFIFLILGVLLSNISRSFSVYIFNCNIFKLINATGIYTKERRKWSIRTYILIEVSGGGLELDQVYWNRGRSNSGEEEEIEREKSILSWGPGVVGLMAVDGGGGTGES